ncbi:MAG TPA: hypothetical protein VH817_23490, partial [Thermoleophilaceae bacterium]
RDVVESISAASLLAATDLNFHSGILGLEADECNIAASGAVRRCGAAKLNVADALCHFRR